MRSDTAWVGVRAVADVRDAVLSKARECEGRLRVHGEVLDYREVQDGYWATLLDKHRPETLEVFFRTSSEPLERGLMVAVEGRLKATKRAGEPTIGFSLIGDTCTVMHVARRHMARKSHIEQLALDLTDKRKQFTDAAIERFWIICGAHSKASLDIKRRFYGHKSKARFVECSIKDAASVAQAIHETVARAGARDALLVTRGGGTAFELDLFNDHRVATALAAATRRLPTMLAIGHAHDELLVRSLVSEVCDTPTHAGRRLAQLCHTHTKPSQRVEQPASQLDLLIQHVLHSLGFGPRRFGLAPRISAVWAPLLFVIGALVGWIARTPLQAASTSHMPTAALRSAPVPAPAINAQPRRASSTAQAPASTSTPSQLAANAAAPSANQAGEPSADLSRRGGL